MISEEEYIKRVMQRTARDVIQTLLRTREYSARFLSRGDAKSIDRTVEKMSIDVVDEFVNALRSRGYLGTGRIAPQTEFQSLFESTVKDYLNRLGKDNNNAR